MNSKNPQFEDEALKVKDLFLVKPYHQGRGEHGMKFLLYVNGNTKVRFFINDMYLIQGIPVVVKDCKKNDDRNILDEFLTVEVVIATIDPTKKFEMKGLSDIKLYRLVSHHQKGVQISHPTSSIKIIP